MYYPRQPEFQKLNHAMIVLIFVCVESSVNLRLKESSSTKKPSQRRHGLHGRTRSIAGDRIKPNTCLFWDSRLHSCLPQQTCSSSTVRMPQTMTRTTRTTTPQTTQANLLIPRRSLSVQVLHCRLFLHLHKSSPRAALVNQTNAIPRETRSSDCHQTLAPRRLTSMT